MQRNHDIEHDDIQEITNLKFAERCRERAGTDIHKSIKDIYDKEIANSSSIPTISFVSIISSMEKIRKTTQPSLPSNIDEIDGAIRQSGLGFIGTSTFYQGWVSSRDEHAFLFGLESQMDMLFQSNAWYMDGTFKIRPMHQTFAQVNFRNIPY